VGAGFPINFEVSEDSAIFTHPLYVKWSTTTIGTALAQKIDLMQDLAAIYPNVDTQEILAYLTSILRILNQMA